MIKVGHVLMAYSLSEDVRKLTEECQRRNVTFSKCDAPTYARLRSYGRELDAEGGLALMQAVALEMGTIYSQAPASLNYIWDKIGEWTA